MHWKAIIKESSETVLVVTIPYAVNRLNDLSTSGLLRLQRGYTATIVAIQRPSWLYSDHRGYTATGAAMCGCGL